MPNFVSRWEATQTLAGRTNWWLPLVVFGLAALVQIAVASRSGLWADETFSLAMVTGHSLEHPAALVDLRQGDFVEPDHPVPAEEFRRYLKHDHPPASPARVIRAVFLSDTNPPLYYLFLYAWTLIFGTSDIVLRAFSIVCSLACLPFLVGIARRTGGRGAVLPACVFFAISPLTIYYSTEGRMYSLLWLCVLATAWTSLVLQQRGGSILICAIWIVASAAGFLTHYFFVFPWLAIVAFLFIRPGKLSRLNLLACLLLTAVLILPWYVKAPESLASWRVTKDWLKMRTGGSRMILFREFVLQFFSGRSSVWWQDLRKIPNIAALILFGIIAAAMVWRLRSQVFGGQRLLLWLSFAAACAGPFVYDLVQDTYLVARPRYAIAALPFAYVLAAVGLTCLDRRIKLIMLILIVLTWLPDITTICRDRLPWLPMREIARAASVDGSPSDLILVHSIPSGVLSIARYACGPTKLASWVGQLGTRHVPESVRALVAGRTRVVFVKVHEVREPAPEEDWLRANAVVFHEARLGTGKIVDFRPINSKSF